MPPLLKQLVLFAALLVFFVVISTEVGASSPIINLQSRCAHLIAGERTNRIFITAYDATFYALSYPTQSKSQILHFNSQVSVETILKCLTNNPVLKAVPATTVDHNRQAIFSACAQNSNNHLKSACVNVQKNVRYMN